MANNKRKRGRSDIPYVQRLQMDRQATIAQHRDQAALTALKIAAVALNDTEGKGYKSIVRFAKRQQELTDEYYTDPVYMEEKLNQRLEQIGFRVVDSRLFGAIDENGNIVSTKNLDEADLPKDKRRDYLENMGLTIVDKEEYESAEKSGADLLTLVPHHTDRADAHCGMKPMEAWSIISANLAHLVKIKRSQGDQKGFVPADTEAEVIAYKALREMEDRIFPKPLKFNEMFLMLDQPVWVEFADEPKLNAWGIVESVSEICNKRYMYLRGTIGEIELTKNVKVYPYKPWEVKGDV